jgi:NSS family neurotransmitter:Na+ symporter
MPLLFVLIVLMTIYSVNLPGARAGISYLIKPDFSKITTSVVAAAMGQSFFSLSLGVGTILTYSSYVRKDENILASGIGTASLDLLFAILAGFAIMPAVFAAGIKPEAGPGLIFQTLPYIFSKMSEHLPFLSASVAVLFFITILVAALTSAISMFEVGVAYLIEERKFSRPAATAVVFSLTWILGVLCSLSFGPLKNFHIVGNTVFGFCDKLTSNFLMTFGGLLFTIFVGWKMPRRAVRDEITSGGRSSLGVHTFNFVYFLIKYLAPAAIVLIFISNLIL